MSKIVQPQILILFLYLKVMANLGAADVDSRLEELLIDGIVYAFQEQTAEVNFPYA